MIPNPHIYISLLPVSAGSALFLESISVCFQQYLGAWERRRQGADVCTTYQLNLSGIKSLVYEAATCTLSSDKL